MTTVIKSRALERGDTISVVVPASPINRERIDRALARIRERGFDVRTYGDIYRAHGYLAGDDQTRAAELMCAFEDPDTRAVWCARGGYGVARLLDRIDFDIIRRHPKIFVGFSDITLLHSVIHERTGLITFHGPNLQDGFGKVEDMPAPNEAALWQALSNAGASTNPSGYIYDLNAIDEVQLEAIRGGTARGQLVGGNLAVLAGVVGTPYDISTAGRILFLEDVSERLYRLDRYLSQLRLAGKFSGLAGVLLGSFSYEDGEQQEAEADVRSLLSEFFAPLGVPVLAGFPAGHEHLNLTLPIGAMMDIDADQHRVMVVDAPVTPH